MKLLHLQPVSTILVATSVAAKPANSVDYQVRSLRLKEDAPDAPFIGPMSGPNEVTRQLSHEPSSSLGDPSDDHRVLEKIDTKADSEKPPTRSLVKQVQVPNPDFYNDGRDSVHPLLLKWPGYVWLHSDYYLLEAFPEHFSYPNEDMKIHTPGPGLVVVSGGNENMKIYAPGPVFVLGTPPGLVLEVHSGVSVVVRGTGRTSKLEVHSDGKVEVHGTGYGSELEVHSKKWVVVRETGRRSKLEVHSNDDVDVHETGPKSTANVHSEKDVTVFDTGSGSTMDVYAKNVKKKSGKKILKFWNQYVTFTKADGSAEMKYRRVFTKSGEGYVKKMNDILKP